MNYRPEIAPPPPSGPLALEWRGFNVPPLRAGVAAHAEVTVRNAGTVTWQPPDTSKRGILLSFHWLDRFDNPIIWEGERTPIPHALAPGDEATLATSIRGPIPPGPYRLTFDLVDEGRCWFAEVGNRPLQLDIDVKPRLVERTLSAHVMTGPAELVSATLRALEKQEEPIQDEGSIVVHLPPGCVPHASWSRQILDAHDSGYGVVGGSVRLTGSRFRGRTIRSNLRPWAPPFGRMPNWRLPLVCPSTAPDVRDWIPIGTPVAGLPTIDMTPHAEPWICDGRIRIDLPIRAAQQVDHLPVETRSTPA